MNSTWVKELLEDEGLRGELAAPTHSARLENPICGDVTELTLEIRNDVVLGSSFRSQGCFAALASAAMVANWVRDKSVRECRDLTTDRLLQMLGDLPSHKRHGAELALEVLEAALDRPRKRSAVASEG